MLRRAAVLGLAVLLAGCTDEIVLPDMPDAGQRDATAGRDTPPPGDVWCYPSWAWLSYQPRVAQVLIVFDRSSAMQTAFGGTTRQEAAEAALLDAIAEYQGRVKFGFEQFPADSADKSYGECQRNSCCASSVKVSPQYNSKSSISGPLDCGGYGFPCPLPTDETAAHAALLKVRDHYRARSSNDDRYVLLVTASEPYCSTLTSSSGDVCEQALSAANDLGDLGVRVVVLSVGYQPTDTSCLVRISNTGSKLPVPSGMKTLYTPSGMSGLYGDIASLARAAAKTACAMESNDTPPPEDASVQISVGTSGIEQVSSTSESGWSFANSSRTSITLSGSACDLFIGSPSYRVSAGYSCSPCGGSPACPWL